MRKSMDQKRLTLVVHSYTFVILCVFFFFWRSARRWRRFTALIKNWLTDGNVAWIMSWNHPHSDSVIYHVTWGLCARTSVRKTETEKRQNKSTTGTNSHEMSCTVCGYVRVCARSPCQKSKQMYFLDIFFFTLDVTQTCCHRDDASRRRPSSIWLITSTVSLVQLCCKYFCWEAGCYSRGGSTQSRPSWDEPKHIPCVTACLCWEEAWPTALWHFIK